MLPIAGTPPGSPKEWPVRLRVAYIYRNFKRAGSIASLYLRTAERLSGEVELTAVCGTRDRAPTEAPIRFVDVDPVLRGSGRIRYAIECRSFASRATRVVLEDPKRYDVVHSEGFASRWADVVTAHAVRRAEVDHYFQHVESGAGVRRRLSPTLFRPQVQVVVGIERALYGSPAPLVVCPSDRIKRDLERWHGVPSELVEVIPYGIDVAAFRHDPSARARIREREGAGEETTVILAVADSFERKGVARLITALGLSRAGPELWVMGGDDPTEYLRRARSAGVAERVRFLGRRPYDELPGWYSACDVIAVVSRQDSWALPVIEGMAAGRVVLASEFTGSNEAIVSGETGFVVGREGEPGAIAGLLDGPLGDPSLRAEIGARAAAEARRYGVEPAHAALLRVYTRAAQRRAERPVPALTERTRSWIAPPSPSRERAG